MKSMISIESDRDANYNLYFQMQNELMEAYAQLRNEAAQKKYHRDYDIFSGLPHCEVAHRLPST